MTDTTPQNPRAFHVMVTPRGAICDLDFMAINRHRQRPPATMMPHLRRQGAVIATAAGRNDPGPCGSSKTFKQCYGWRK